MPKDVLILSEAAAEAQTAYEWYAERSVKAAARFEEEFDRAVNSIRENPGRWPEYLNRTRAYQLAGYPYILVYRELDARIELIAVAHMHRSEGYWRGRSQS